jgi:UDP-2,3-diacylglucosamine pyrophosphatase LpxH
MSIFIKLKNGDKVWVIHGDQFDGVVQCHRWLAFLGDWAYETVLNMNRWFNAARRAFGVWLLVVIRLP